jgi:hypothetical protein
MSNSRHAADPHAPADAVYRNVAVLAVLKFSLAMTQISATHCLMSKIIGYVGNRDLLQIFLDGRTSLEHRTCDSARMVTVIDSESNILWMIGRLGNLINVIDRVKITGSV